MSPFAVFSLPRSRSFWVSRYLNYGGWTCAHDQAVHVRSVDDVRSWLSLDFTGTVETAGTMFWRMVRMIRPETRLVVVRRSVADVVASLTKLGITFDEAKLTATMQRFDRRLDQIEAVGALSVQFENLNEAATRKRLFEHCLGLPFDTAWDERFAAANLQINLPAQLRYQRANAPQLRKAEALCVRWIKNRTRETKVRLGEPRPDGVTIQEEYSATVHRDGADLFAEHCKAVGEPEDQWTRKNIPLMYQLEDAGLMQFVTARLNGRLIAYLQTPMGPSLEEIGRLWGAQALFFVSESARGMGLGMALQRASIDLLKRRGLGEITMRAGIRGEGPRLGILYRRLGAEEFGHLYRLDLRKAA